MEEKKISDFKESDITFDAMSKPLTIQQQPSTALMVQMAIEKDLDINKLEKLLELHERNESRLAEKKFEHCFAEMQKDYIPAFKTKSGAKDAYKYCSLDGIQEVYMPILSKHGFSVRWDERELPEKKEKEVECYLSGHGFTRSAKISLPYGEQNNMINSIQARAITNSYGRRYTFVAVTGCIVADETDDDGQLPEEKLTEKENNEKLKKTLIKALAFIPPGFRNELQKELSEEKSLEKTAMKIYNLKKLCSELRAKAKLKGSDEYNKVTAMLKKATTKSNLVDCEAYCDSL